MNKSKHRSERITTMKSIFNKPDNAEIIGRINKLTASSAAQWGTMNVSQMMVHTREPVRVAFGELKLERSVVGILFGWLAKKKLLSDKPFGKNMPTDKNFIVHNSPDFEEERNRLVAIVKRCAEEGAGAFTIEPHPFFGKLTSREWDALLWKHLDHHLKQFGV